LLLGVLESAQICVDNEDKKGVELGFIQKVLSEFLPCSLGTSRVPKLSLEGSVRPSSSIKRAVLSLSNNNIEHSGGG